MTYEDQPREYLAEYPNALKQDPPTVLNGKYKVMDVLGQGSFGITYLVVTPDNNKFAIKEYFHKAYCERSEDNNMAYSQKAEGADEVRQGLEYFKQEAKMLVQMTSDNRRMATSKEVSQKTALLAGANYNIVKVERTFEENNTCYFVMEYLDGGNLMQQINGPMDEAKAISLITPIAWAVQHLHENRMMHMDIKPDNIVLASSGDNEYKMLDPKLIDFGTTLRYNAKKELTTTSLRKKAFGTPGYCSREHDAIMTFAPHLDVYSLGATLLHMLTGQVPPKAELVNDVLDKWLDNYHVSQRTQRAIKHAMSYKAQDRTQSAIDFINELAPQFLPIGYILRSGHHIYRILSVERQEDDYISYRAERQLKDQPAHQGGTVLKERNDDGKGYLIHECFARMLCHRGDNMEVIADRGKWAEIDKREFLDHVVKHTGLKNVSGLIADKSGRPLAEIFEANGTLYSVKRKGYSAKQEQQWMALKNLGKRSWKPLMALVVLSGLGITYHENAEQFQAFLSSCSNRNIDEPVDMIPVDTAALSHVQDTTIVTANNDTGNTVKPIEPDKPTQLERFNKAQKNGDMTEMKALANEGYAKAYYPLASYYYRQKNYKQAEKWANKAIKNSSGSADAKKLLAMIKEETSPPDRPVSIDLDKEAIEAYNRGDSAALISFARRGSTKAQQLCKLNHFKY